MQDKEKKRGSIWASTINCLQSIFEYSKIYFFITIIVTIIQGLMPATFILVMQKIVNLLQRASNSGRFDEIIKYIVIYIVLNISNLAIESIYNYYKTQFLLRFANHINLKMLEQATSLMLSNYEEPETYNIIDRAQGQGGSSILSYASEILGVFKHVVMMGSTIAILVNYRLWIVWIVLIPPIVRCIISVMIDKKWYNLRVARTQEERKSWYINFLLLTGRAFKEIKILGISKYLVKKYEDITKRIIDQDLKMEKYSSFFLMIIDLVEWIITGGVFTYTVLLGFAKTILIGDVTAYIECIENVKNSARSIFQSFGNVMEQSLYLDFLFQYLDIPVAQETKKTQIQSIKKIELRDVSFKYRNGKYALKKINIVLESDSRIAFVGENGSGKTTLIKLILGLYEEYEGEIIVNGINLKELDIKEYQKRIGCVFQDYMRYEMTVRENIAFGDIDKIQNEREIRERIRAVRLEKRISESDDLNMVLGNWFGDQELSTGEWQRVAIARALMKDADVFILDEPDASLDIQKQNDLIEVYKNTTSNKALIYVSHKINYVHLLTNSIYVLEDGRIVEEGNHEELMNRKKNYYKMYKHCKMD